MSSIVLELQAEAMNSTSDLGTLMRKSLAIATKLKLSEWVSWCKFELNGYPANAEIPAYRYLYGELKMFNPYNGIWMQFPNAKMFRTFCSQSIAEVQDLATSKGMLRIPAPEAAKFIEMVLSPPQLFVSKTSMVGILDAVRNTVLEWTLKLETDGVLGEGMTFSQQEKQIVMTNQNHYTIGTFNGVLGNVSGGSFQIGDYNQFEPQLKDANVPNEEREELKRLMAEFTRANSKQRKTILSRGIDWTLRNAPAIGTLSNTIREWFENNAGS